MVDGHCLAYDELILRPIVSAIARTQPREKRQDNDTKPYSVHIEY
jgi:hypothetical protein